MLCTQFSFAHRLVRSNAPRTLAFTVFILSHAAVFSSHAFMMPGPLCIVRDNRRGLVIDISTSMV